MIATIQYGIPVARIELLDALSVKAVNAYSGLTLPETPLLLLEFHGSQGSVEEQAAAFGEIAAETGGTGFRVDDQMPRNARNCGKHATMLTGPPCSFVPAQRSLTSDVCVPISRLAECVNAAQRNGLPNSASKRRSSAMSATETSIPSSS